MTIKLFCDELLNFFGRFELFCLVDGIERKDGTSGDALNSMIVDDDRVAVGIPPALESDGN
jgi:hypothetical protein